MAVTYAAAYASMIWGTGNLDDSDPVAQYSLTDKTAVRDNWGKYLQESGIRTIDDDDPKRAYMSNTSILVNENDPINGHNNILFGRSAIYYE